MQANNMHGHFRKSDRTRNRIALHGNHIRNTGIVAGRQTLGVTHTCVKRRKIAAT